jgi:hypothetical protein
MKYIYLQNRGQFKWLVEKQKVLLQSFPAYGKFHLNLP